MICGESVTIRGISKKDAKLIFNWVNQQELRDLTGSLYPVSEYEHEKWIEAVCLESNKKLFSIYSNDKCIGTIGLKNFDYKNRNVELFISIGDTGSQNKGAGTDAVKTVVSYCFEHLNFHKVYLKVFESNIRAIRCYEKAGMSIEGKLIDHHFTRGRYEALLIMASIKK